MKHPPLQLLQDYFENVLVSQQETLVGEHVHECDQCTKVLADFAVIETRMKLSPGTAVSENMKKRIFSSARELLEEKRRLPEPGILESFWNEWKDMSFPELKVPALQLCSLSIVLLVFVEMEKEQSRKIEVFEPLSDEVQVLTYKEIEENK